MVFFFNHDHPTIKCFCVFEFLRRFLVALSIRCFMLTIFVKSFGVFCIYTISIFISTEKARYSWEGSSQKHHYLGTKKNQHLSYYESTKKNTKNDKCSTKILPNSPKKSLLQVVKLFHPYILFGTFAFLWPAVVAAVLALEKAAAVAVAAALAKLNLPNYANLAGRSPHFQ